VFEERETKMLSAEFVSPPFGLFLLQDVVSAANPAKREAQRNIFFIF
jgi:hypothetical protein